MSKAVTMEDVAEVPTRRFSSTSPELDRIFGSSRRYDEHTREIIGEDWGIARGKLWLMGGEEGVGKTRFYSMVAAILAEMAGKIVLIFQKEMTAGEYKELLMNVYRAMKMEPKHLGNIYFEQTKKLSRQVELIRELKPDLVIDDSFNLTSEPNAKTQKGIEQIVTEWKAAMGSHTAAWMIAHLNAAGGIKGNGHIKYMVDAIFFLEQAETPETRYEQHYPELCKGRFSIRSAKTRQGIKGAKAYLRHEGDSPRVIRDDEVQKWLTDPSLQTTQSAERPAEVMEKPPFHSQSVSWETEFRARTMATLEKMRSSGVKSSS